MTTTSPSPTHLATRRRRVGRIAALTMGLAATILAVQPALALSWGMQTRLSSSTVNRPVVLRTGPSRAIALWQVGTAILSRRTLDGGTTWTPTATVTTGINLDFSASALGNYVDLAYVKKVTSNGTTSLRLYYKRSLDAGVTWQTAQRLTSTVSKVMDQGVARGPNGQVSVVWTGYSTGNLYTRSSTDAGTTFTSARYVGHTGNWEPGRTITYRSDPAVAIGSGVIYVAYTADTDTLAVRRTTDRGLHWSAAKTLSTHATDRPALIAAGSQAMIGYTSTATGSMRAIVRRTTDKGVTWSASATLTSHASGTFSMTPQLAYRDGVLAVTYKYGAVGNSPVWHRQSTNFGLTWSSATKVSLVNDSTFDPEPAGLAILDTGHLAGTMEHGRDTDDGLWVRRTQ